MTKHFFYSIQIPSTGDGVTGVFEIDDFKEGTYQEAYDSLVGAYAEHYEVATEEVIMMNFNTLN